MALLIALSFLLVFVTAVFLAFTMGGDGTRQAEKTRQLLESVTSPVRDGTDLQLDVRKRQIFSTIPWLNQRLTQMNLPHRLQLLLAQANLRWTPSRFLLVSAVFGAFTWYLVYMRTDVALISLAVGVVVAILPFFYVLGRREQQLRDFERLLPDAIGHMVSALRAGQSLTSALGVVVREVPDPIAREFRICFDEQNFGLDLRTAMHNLTERVPLPDVQMVVTAILIQKESGGNLAEILEKTAAVVRERFRLQRQIQVHTAQGRLTGWILSALPSVLGLLLYLLNPDNMSVLWKRQVGIEILWAAFIMNVIGLWIIRRIVRIRL